MNFLFAWRYFRAKKSTNAINVIAWISMLSILCITFAFIVVLSVFNGFEGLVKSLYSSFYTDIRIEAKTGKYLTVSESQLSALSTQQHIHAYTPTLEEKVLLMNKDVQVITDLKAVDTSYTSVNEVKDYMIRGELYLGDNEKPAIVLGSGVEAALGILADRSIYPLTVYISRKGQTALTANPIDAFSAANIQTAGAFQIQADIDNKYSLTNLHFMREMTKTASDEYTAIEISLKQPDKVATAKKSLQQLFPGAKVLTRYEQNESLFNLMNMEKWATYALLTLMLVVAAFAMIGSLSMLVLEKKKDIQVLKALGASQRKIRNIFLAEGFLLSSIGAIIGTLLAIIFCYLQQSVGLIKISGSTFLVSYYPVAIDYGQIAIILSIVILITLAASWYPAKKAALQPFNLKV